jgi:hypothetical protein
MSKKNVVIETLKKKKAELEAQIAEIDETLRDMGEFIPKEPIHDQIYDDTNPDYIKASQEEI